MGNLHSYIFCGLNQSCDLNSQRQRRLVTLLRLWDRVAPKTTRSQRKQKAKNMQPNHKAKTCANSHVKCSQRHAATRRRIIQRAPCRPPPAGPQWRGRSKHTPPSRTHTRSVCQILLWRKTGRFAPSSRARGHLRTLLHLLRASATQHPAAQNFRGQRNRQQASELTMRNSRVLVAHTLLHTHYTQRQRCV